MDAKQEILNHLEQARLSLGRALALDMEHKKLLLAEVKEAKLIQRQIQRLADSINSLEGIL